MPKELNVSPNQRIDLEDFEYGTRTFTVDSLRAHVTRMFAGGYRGGFVLEGFRVAVSSLSDEMSVSVTNGIALDRSGRLVTFEEGNYFLNNPLASKSVNLIEASAVNYLMVEYTLANEDPQERAFWDPTYPAAPVTDSGGDTVPVPKGKEFDLSVVTRKAQSWVPVISTTGFEDSTDPNVIRIPIAIIPIDTGGPSVDLVVGTDTRFPTTSLIEKPRARQEVSPWSALKIQYIQCADTRTFASTGHIQVLNTLTQARTFNNGTSNVTTIEYTSNDRQNNRLYIESGITVGTGNDVDGFPYGEPEITDIVQQVASGGSSPLYYLKEGSKYDCRPMFFAMTEADGSRQENSNDWPVNVDGERRNDSRQFKYWSGLALLTDPYPVFSNPSYPESLGGPQQKKYYSAGASRIETRIKQNQDFFRVLGALVEEMKYGVARVIKGDWTENENSLTGYLPDLGITPPTTGTGKYLIDGTKIFSQEYVGATVSIISAAVPANVGKRLTVKKVFGANVLEFETPTGNGFSANDQYEIELNYPGSRTGFVDHFKTGSLHEVFDGRIDDFTGTYTGYLSSRLTANKVATITVGDGVSTFGDYTGSLGLWTAFTQAYKYARETVIYVKSGTYEFSGATYLNYGPVFIGPNTKIVGDGIDETIIQFTGNSVTQSNYFRLADYKENYLKEGSATYGGTNAVRVAGVQFKDLTIRQEQHHPVISNMTLERKSDSSTAITGAGGVTDGVMTPLFSETNSDGVLKDAQASLVENLKFIRVKITGGGYGNYTADDAGQSFYGEAFTSNPQVIDKSATYAINLFAGDRYLTTYNNKNIQFSDCEFVNKGGVGYFESCLNIAFNNCKFHNTDVFTAFESSSIPVYGVEGITFVSRQNRNIFAAIPPTEIGWQDSSTSLDYSGNVIVDGCSFLGKLDQSILSGQATSFKRGWINFAPSYAGPLASVSNCKFLMNMHGDNTVAKPYPQQIGWFGGDNSEDSNYEHSCIYKGSSTPLDISNSQFFDAWDGIVSQMGATSITGCSFYNCQNSVRANGLRTYDTGDTTDIRGCTSFYRGYGAYYKMSFSTTVSNCRFIGEGTDNGSLDDGASGGVRIDGNDLSYADSRARVEVKGCTFADLKSAIYLLLGPTTGVDTGTVPMTFPTDGFGGLEGAARHRPRWDDISVSECSFTRSKQIIYWNGDGHVGGINNADGWQTSATADVEYAKVFFWVNNFNFNNNTINDFSVSPKLISVKDYGLAMGATSFPGASPLYHAAYGQIVAKNIQVTGNKITDIFPSARSGYADKDHLALFALCVGWDLEFSRNEIAQFYDETGKTVIADIFQCSGGVNEGQSGNNDKARLLKICENNYTNYQASGALGAFSGLTTNGFWIGVISRDYQETLTVFGPTSLVTGLRFNNNTLALNNANFGLVADQQYGLTTADNGGAPGIFADMRITGSDEVWAWGNAEVRGNRIVDSQFWPGGTPSTNLQYGNDIGNPCTLIEIEDPSAGTSGTKYFTGAGAADGNYFSYLGAASGATGRPSKYSALVDLRCFSGNASQTSGGVVDVRHNDGCLITNNVFNVSSITGTDLNLWPKPADSNVRELIGVRISKFPTKMEVDSNEFTNAPLILEWKYKNPYVKFGGLTLTGTENNRRADFLNGGYSLKINNNNINSSARWHSVYVDSATGWPVKNTSSGSAISVDDVYELYVNLQFQNNTVRASNESCLSGSPTHNQSNYDAQSNLVTFWHPDISTLRYGNSTVNYATGANGPFANWLTVATGYHVLQRWGRYVWMISDNTFYNSFTKITEQFNGGAAPANNELNQAASGTATTAAEGYYQFANIDNNFYVFVSDSYPIDGGDVVILGLGSAAINFYNAAAASMVAHRGSAKGNKALVGGTLHKLAGSAEGTTLT